MGKYRKYPLLPILVMLILGTMSLGHSDNSEESYMLTLINNERLAQGLEPLTMNSSLAYVARLHSQDMINRSFFNHVNPDGLTPSDRARNGGYSFIALAENICGNSSIDAGHSSLMGSPSHRTNILNPSYKEVGIGIVDGGPYGKMITQLFGTQSKVTNSQTTQEETKANITLPITSNQIDKADLYISTNDLSYNQIVYEGASSLVSFRIRNIGKSNAFGVPIKIYVNGELKASSTVTQIPTSSYTDFALYLTFPNSGDNVVDIRIDPDNSIDEISKLNNYINFAMKVLPRENTPSSKHNNNQNIKITSHDIDLLIYPYYITIEEQENGFLLIKTKIKNRGDITVDDFSVTFYERDTNSSNDMFIERVYLSLGPEKIVEENITFIPTTKKGEIIVVIDEENKIKETDENNNIATKIFSNIINESYIPEMGSDLVLNTTPEEVDISNLLKVTMKLKDINASNAYLYYKYYNDINSSFFILKMDNEGNHSYSKDVDPLGRTNLFYYFEVETENNMIKSPSKSPNELYSIIINYQQSTDEKSNSSFLGNIKKIFRLE